MTAATKVPKQISEKTAKKEYLLTVQEIEGAIAAGLLTATQKTTGFGTTYRSFSAEQIKALSASRPFDETRAQAQKAFQLKETAKKLSKALKKKSGLVSIAASSSSSTGNGKPPSAKSLERLEKLIVDLKAVQSSLTAPSAPSAPAPAA